MKLHKSFKTVVSVNYSSVQIVEVGSCKSAAVKLYHRTNIRRNNRDNIKNHPLKLITAVYESVNNIKSFKELCSLLTCCTFKFCSEFVTKFFGINFGKKLFDSLCTHACLKVVFVSLTHILILFFCKSLLLLKRSITRINYDIKSKVKDLFKISLVNIENLTDTARNTLKVPNV